MRENIDELEGEIHGTLKLAAASIIGQHWLPNVLKTYVKQYPNVKISLVTGWSSEMLKSLYEDHVHVGIIRGNPEWKGPKHYLMRDELYLVDTEIRNIEDIAKRNGRSSSSKATVRTIRKFSTGGIKSLKRRQSRPLLSTKLKHANRWLSTESAMRSFHL